jgi:hypothetical protein
MELVLMGAFIRGVILFWFAVLFVGKNNIKLSPRFSRFERPERVRNLFLLASCCASQLIELLIVNVGLASMPYGGSKLALSFLVDVALAGGIVKCVLSTSFKKAAAVALTFTAGEFASILFVAFL